MNTPLKKRFWKEVTVGQDADGFAVLLDGRALKTPAKAPLRAPTKALAEGIAAEWAAVEEKIDPRKMHLTRCANATIDKVTQQHADVAAMLAEYGGTDLLCYRADSPQGLAARQQAAWDPLLQWLQDTHGVSLVTTTGLIHVAQPPESLARLHDLVLAHDPWRLTALHDLVTISGSLVIGLGVASGGISLETGWKASRVDEDWQAEQWGEDEEAVAAAALKRADFGKAAHLLALLEAETGESA